MNNLLVNLIGFFVFVGGWIVALILLIMWTHKNKKLKWISNIAKAMHAEARVKAQTLEKKQAKLAKAQKQIKRLERDLKKNNPAKLS